MSIFDGIERDAIDQIVSTFKYKIDMINSRIDRLEFKLEEIIPYYKLHTETQNLFMEKVIERIEAIEKKMVDIEFNHKLVNALVELIKR